jgi:hypothetical protein
LANCTYSTLVIVELRRFVKFVAAPGVEHLGLVLPMALRDSATYFWIVSANVGSDALIFSKAPGFTSSASRFFIQSLAAGSRSKVSVSL